MIKIYIAGEEILCDKNLIIEEEILSTPSTILKNCYPKAWSISEDLINKFYFPKDYSKCEIYRDEDLIFAGVVKNTGNIDLNPFKPHYCDLQVLDYKTFLSEGDSLDFVIDNKTITEAIAIVIDKIASYGFEIGNINIIGENDIIKAYSTLNKTAYDVFQYIADITQSKWFTRRIDEKRIAIDFYDPTLLPSGDNIKYNSTYFEDNNIIDISFSYSTNDYRNKQIMLSDEVYGNIDYNEIVFSDGYNKTFNVNSPIGVLKKITVNGVEASFSKKSQKELGIETDFYYTPNETSIESDKSYPSGTEINIIYTPIVKGRQVIYNNDEIERINNQISRNGIVSRYETRSDVLSNNELNKIGQSYIRYKGSAEVTLTVKTKDKDLFNVGEIIFFEAPISDLQQNYLVKKKTTKIISIGNDYIMFYTYELTSSYNSERAINYFDNQRNKTVGNIGEGEIVTRNIDIENEALITFYDLGVEELEAGNILNSILNSPLVE